MSGWDDLDRELIAWGREGRTATLWWRDDDAIEPTPALERMIGLSDLYEVPLALAVVPKHATAALSERVNKAEMTFCLQHGWQHQNHAPQGQKAAEFGAHRPLDAMLAEAREGFSRLANFPSFVPAFVPPWNRATPALHDGLKQIGLRGLSGYGARDEKQPVEGFTLANTHADIIAWKAGRGFVGEEKLFLELNGHLAARRTGAADPLEPTGLLTHHLVHDEASWAFLERLFKRLANEPAVRWLSPHDIFISGAAA